MLKGLLFAFAAITASSCESGPSNGTLGQSVAVGRAPTPADDIAAITALEDRWSRAFLERDMAFLEEIIAPEFEVHGWRGGKYASTGRELWMEGVRTWVFKEHPSRVLHVKLYNDTAIATVQGKLVAERNGRPYRYNEWIVTDTWVRRDGRWQVVFRYADTLPGTCKVGCGEHTE